MTCSLILLAMSILIAALIVWKPDSKYIFVLIVLLTSITLTNLVQVLVHTFK